MRFYIEKNSIALIILAECHKELTQRYKNVITKQAIKTLFL